jgi:hypothetical protein
VSAQPGDDVWVSRKFLLPEDGRSLAEMKTVIVPAFCPEVQSLPRRK